MFFFIEFHIRVCDNLMTFSKNVNSNHGILRYLLHSVTVLFHVRHVLRYSQLCVRRKQVLYTYILTCSTNHIYQIM